MAQNFYSELYYHFVWRTKDRVRLILPEFEKTVWLQIKDKCVKYGGIPLEVGGIEDHVHMLIGGPPTLLLSEFIGKVKGASSHDINASRLFRSRFAWGEGYGVLSLAKRDVPGVRNYIRRQREHHTAGTANATMERIEPDDVG